MIDAGNLFLLSFFIFLLINQLFLIWRQSQLLKKNLNLHQMKKQLHHLKTITDSISLQLDKTMLEALRIKSGGEQTHQTASHMLDQGASNEAILSACQLSKSELDLLRVIHTKP